MQKNRWVSALHAVAAAFFLVAAMPAAHASVALVTRVGTDFTGGGNKSVGSVFYGESDLNLVYAQATKSASRIATQFTLDFLPTKPEFLYLTGRRDATANPLPLKIQINKTTIFQGDSPFPKDKFDQHKFPIPTTALRVGDNTITVENLSPNGHISDVPWFMVERCTIAPDSYVALPTPDKIRLELPTAKDSFIEKAAAGEPMTGFEFRGIKGYNWTPDQYLEQIPILAQYKMNFLMIGYESMFSGPRTPEHYNTMVNNWWEPIPEAKKAGYAKVFALCRQDGIQCCFGLNPQLVTTRPMDLTSDKDFADFYQHYAWAQSEGVHWFTVCLDDISGVKIDPKQHANLVNKLLAKLRVKDPTAQMIFCPTYYAGDGTGQVQRKYLAELAKDLDPSVYIFWTGFYQQTSADQAAMFKSIVKHPLFFWDNYPVSDGTLSMHLAPITGRDPDLPKVVAGYMANPFFTMIKATRIPVFTQADFAYDPQDYDPQKSIGQAIIHQTDSPIQRQALFELVQLCATAIGRTTADPVVERFQQISSPPYSRAVAKNYIDYVRSVQKDFVAAFPTSWQPTKNSLANSISDIQTLYVQKYGQ